MIVNWQREGFVVNGIPGLRCLPPEHPQAHALLQQHTMESWARSSKQIVKPQSKPRDSYSWLNEVLKWMKAFSSNLKNPL